MAKPETVLERLSTATLALTGVATAERLLWSFARMSVALERYLHQRRAHFLSSQSQSKSERPIAVVSSLT